MKPLAIAYNLGLAIDAGFVNGREAGGGSFLLEGLTWSGHDFLDSVRDDEIWRRTKEGGEINRNRVAMTLHSTPKHIAADTGDGAYCRRIADG